MTSRNAATQQELNEALHDPTVTEIHIYGDGDGGTQALTVLQARTGVLITANDRSSLTVYGRCVVEAHDQARVHVYDDVVVHARDNAQVYARGNSVVRAYDNAHVNAGSGSTVYAHDTTTVTASGRVTVHAAGYTCVRASGRAVVTAADGVAVHRRHDSVAVTGGTVIDAPRADTGDAAEWCAYHGVETVVVDGQTMAVLFKAVDSELTAGRQYRRPTRYPVGARVTCDDWNDEPVCGGGLHLCATPHEAAGYAEALPNGKVRYLRVHAPVDTLRVISEDKVKAPAVYVVAEVDAFHRDIPADAHTAALAAGRCPDCSMPLTAYEKTAVCEAGCGTAWGPPPTGGTP